MHVWKNGDRLRVTYRGQTVDATVKLASPNGRSLFLEFEALLGGFAGRMPIMFVDDDPGSAPGFRDIVMGEPVRLEKGLTS